MFKFLKEKLKNAVSKFSKKVEEEADIKEEVREVETPKTKSLDAKDESLSKPVEEVKKEPEIKEEAPEDKIKEELEEDLKEEIKEAEEEKAREEEKKAKKKETHKEKEIQKEQEEFLTDEAPEIEVEQIEEEFWEEEKEKQEAKKKEEKEKSKKPSFFKKLFSKKEEKPTTEAKKASEPVAMPQKPEPKPEPKPEVKELKPVKPEIKEPKKQKEPEVTFPPEPEEPEEKKGLFKKIKESFTTIKISEEKFEKLFWELEVVLLESNVAVDVIDKIKSDLRTELTTGKVSRKGVYELIEDSLRKSVESLFIDQHFSLVKEIKKKKEKPYVVAFIGVNGSGKTTTMAKVAHLLLENNLSVVFAASDTFRAAAIQQLQEHADKLGVKMIKHDYESDPAAVAFDAIAHAKSKAIDVVMIDTAGRLHSNDNLMNELKKLLRVNKPDLKIFIGESITGNDCIEQAKLFNEAVGIDVIILAKADVDEKGGAAVSVSYVTKKPIIYLGTGQTYNDLTEFKPEIIIKNIGL